MSEEALQRSEEAIEEAKQAEPSVMPFDDAASPAGRTPRNPEESGGAVAEHGDEEGGAVDEAPRETPVEGDSGR
jgi:hypothetical protein